MKRVTLKSPKPAAVSRSTSIVAALLGGSDSWKDREGELVGG